MLEGRGVEADPATAIAWLEADGAAGYGPALRTLSELHAEGRHVAADPERAQALLEAAADAGDREARRRLSGR
jgi:TPR repeat protein